MKLGADVLLEIVNAVQFGLMMQEDVSEQLRMLDLEEEDGVLVLSEKYKSMKKN